MRQIGIAEKPPLTQALPLAVQHVFAMFGATVLVPFLTGLSPSAALLTSGIGTLIFHFFTRNKVPAYLGSSFAFIAPLALYVTEHHSLSEAMGGAIIAGLVYVVIYFIIRYFGSDFIHKYIPNVVVGPVVMIIGLSLASTAVNDMASQNWIVAIFTLALAIIFTIFGRGLISVIPILLAIIGGYIFTIILQITGVIPELIDLSAIASASLFENPTTFYATNYTGQVWSFLGFHLPIPSFTLAAIMTIAPIAFVTIIEDLGHIFVIDNVTEQNLIEDPGFDKVLLGNGLATAAAAFLGGPPSTTYGENIGVLAITKVYSSWVIRIAAVIAIILSFIGVLNAILLSIPSAIMGGISILLFGMIAAAGMRTLIEARTDLSKTKNLIIVAIILIIGVGSGKVGFATLAGIILNLILPEKAEN